MQIVNFPTSLWIGEDSLQGLTERPETSFFIVTDPFIRQSGLLDDVLTALAAKDVVVFSEIVPDPPVSVVTAGVAQIEAVKPEAILAIGGGSAIDAAKAMYYFAGKVANSSIKTFIAVPTTSGTGSEVTNFSVITLENEGVKYPLVTDEIQPHIAILNPLLVKSVPPAITADTGMDVLSHLMEAYVSTKENVLSDVLVEYAIQQVFTYLRVAYRDGENFEARQQMHVASCLAGMAFNMSGLGLVHGLAHALGGQFHLPHGRLNAMILPHVIAYNAELSTRTGEPNRAAKRYARLAKILEPNLIGNPKMAVKSLLRQVTQLQKDLHLPQKLSACGIERQAYLQALTTVGEAALADACTSTNPRRPTLDEIQALLTDLI